MSALPAGVIVAFEIVGVVLVTAVLLYAVYRVTEERAAPVKERPSAAPFIYRNVDAGGARYGPVLWRVDPGTSSYLL